MQSNVICRAIKEEAHGLLRHPSCFIFAADFNTLFFIVKLKHRDINVLLSRYRDIKTFGGPTDCRRRNLDKLHFRFNTSLSRVNPAKVKDNIACNNMEKEKVYNKNSHLITACLDDEFRCITYSLYLNYE